MQELAIKTRTSSYPIYVGKDCLLNLQSFTEKASRVIVVTDETVHHLHYSYLQQYLPKNSLVYVLEPGEGSKSFESYYHLQYFLIQHQIDRGSLVLAFGGGVVGDLAGFVAATYMRGIDFIQIPTTLLAHDSAIGGKVAINHEQGKNLIGAFYPPKAVIYELPLLLTLSDKEWRSGLAEMLKHGFIQDTYLLDELMQRTSIIKLNNSNFSDLLERSLRVKQHLVEMDEFEKGQRAFLNFGHTFGHAVELTNKALSHGEAVAIGMLFALYVSQLELGLSYHLDELIKYLTEWGYPLEIDELKLNEYMEYMSHDKKNVNQGLRFVLLEHVAKPQLVILTKEKTKDYLQQFLVWLKDRRELTCV